MSNYMGIDLSFAKSGVAVIEVKGGAPSIKMAHLIKSDTRKDPTERIDDTVTEIKYIASKTNPEVVLKEACVVGRASTAVNVIMTHGVYEDTLSDKYRLEDVHNATIKAWARKVTGKKSTRENKKTLTAEAVEKYYGKVDAMWTPRGALKDDVADAIALTTLWLEREGIIEEKFKKEATK